MIAEARFARAVLVIAELDKRLVRTGLRGELLAEQCINRERMEYLSDDAREALYYVSGWQRKPSPFRVWRNNRKQYRNSLQKSVKTVET
jgi:hypothetical protein